MVIEEGYRSHVYVDKMGNRSIGIGHRLLKNEDFTSLNDAQIDALFKKDLNVAINHFNEIFYLKARFSSEINVAIISIIFNLGPSGFDKFENLIAALKVHDYNEAIIQITNSLWYKQVPNRAKRVIEVLAKE